MTGLARKVIDGIVAEERRQEPRLLGAAAYDAKAIEARNWSAFAPASVAA